MNLTQKIRIFPSQEQGQVLWMISEKCRLIYNFALAQRIEDWLQNKDKPKEERQCIDYLDQSRALTSLKKKYPEYKWVYSKVLQTTLKKLESKYKSFFALWKNGDTSARPPRFKNKKYFTIFCYNQSGFKLQENSITFSHKHPSQTVLEFELPSHLIPEKKIKQVELFLSNKK